ncbi:MAG: glycosyltransferase family 4 protein [Ilumatobacteraceae bacterium]|nr:glycosyltransferase family 4 protein [Ilumatobacteraceae bacterium]
MPQPLEAPLRVAYTLEQCWHPVPGGTAVAALRVAEALRARSDVELHQVAGRHPKMPQPEYRPTGELAMLPLNRPLLYETWNRLNWPKVESVIGEIDVAHATGLVPCGTNAPLAVTVHDLAFLHDPSQFTRHGVRTMRRSLSAVAARADRVLCPSIGTLDDCARAGIDESRLRHVPWGVDTVSVAEADIERVRRRYRLPAEFVLFVGTLEPRKNLPRLVEALDGGALPLVVAGAHGWGDRPDLDRTHVFPIGFVDAADLPALYAAAAVFAYPSEREGFGLPVAEAMSQGTPVVTSRGTSTEEVAGGAAVLVDPFDTVDIGRGIADALDRRDELMQRSRSRASELSWAASADATIAVYRELSR